MEDANKKKYLGLLLDIMPLKLHNTDYTYMYTLTIYLNIDYFLYVICCLVRGKVFI